MVIDDSARISGVWTGAITYIGSLLTAPPDEVLWQIVTMIISGFFGVASSLAVALLKHWLDLRKAKRDQAKDSVE